MANIPTITVDSGSNPNSASNSTSRFNSISPSPSNKRLAFNQPIHQNNNNSTLTRLTSNLGGQGISSAQQHHTQPRPIYSQIRVLPKTLKQIANTKDNKLKNNVSFDTIAIQVSSDDHHHDFDDMDYHDPEPLHTVISNDPPEFGSYTSLNQFSTLSNIDSRTPAQVKDKKMQRDGFAQNLGIREDTLVRNYIHPNYKKYIRHFGKGRTFIIMVSGRRHTWVSLDYVVSKLLRDGDHLVIVSRIPDAYLDEILKQGRERSRERKARREQHEDNENNEDKDADDEQDEEKEEEVSCKPDTHSTHSKADSGYERPKKNKEDLDPDILLEVAENIRNYVEFLRNNNDIIFKLSVEIYVSRNSRIVLNEVMKVHDPQYIICAMKLNDKFTKSISWKTTRQSDRLVQFCGLPVIVVPAVKSDAFEFTLWKNLVMDYNLRASELDIKLRLDQEERLQTKLELLKSSQDASTFLKNKLTNFKTRIDGEEESSSDSEDDSKSLRERGRKLNKEERPGSGSVSLASGRSSTTDPTSTAMPRSPEKIDVVSDFSEESEGSSSEEDSDLDEDDVAADDTSIFGLQLKLARDERIIKNFCETLTTPTPSAFADLLIHVSKVNNGMNLTFQRLINTDSESAGLVRSITGMPVMTKAKSMLDDVPHTAKENNELRRKLEFGQIHSNSNSNQKSMGQPYNPGPPSANSKSIKFDTPRQPSAMSSDSLRKLHTNVDITNRRRPELSAVRSASMIQSNSGSRSSLNSVASNTSNGSTKTKKSFLKKLFGRF